MVKNSDKSNYRYSGYGIAFDGAGSWNFGNDRIKNVVIFGVDNISSSHGDNHKINFPVLGEGPTNDIKGGVGCAEQKLSINFTKPKKKFCLSFHYNGNNSYLFVHGKKSLSLKLIIKI